MKIRMLFFCFDFISSVLIKDDMVKWRSGVSLVSRKTTTSYSKTNLENRSIKPFPAEWCNANVRDLAIVDEEDLFPVVEWVPIVLPIVEAIMAFCNRFFHQNIHYFWHFYQWYFTHSLSWSIQISIS